MSLATIVIHAFAVASCKHERTRSYLNSHPRPWEYAKCKNCGAELHHGKVVAFDRND